LDRVAYLSMVLDRVRRAEFLEPDEELVDATSAHLGRPFHQPGGVVSILMAGVVGFVVGLALRPLGLAAAVVGVFVAWVATLAYAGRIADRRYGREVSLASLPWIGLARTSRRVVALDYRALRRDEVTLLRDVPLASISGITIQGRKALGLIPMTTTVTVHITGDEPDMDLSWSGTARRLRRFVQGLTKEDGLSSGA
jgi:hypothetical protein